jgi:hypothetical protein
MGDRFKIAFPPNAKHAFVEMFGQVNGEDVYRAMAAVYSDPKWKKDFDVAWDLTSVTQLLFEWGDFTQWIELDSDLADLVGSGRDLILVNSDLHASVVQAYALIAARTHRKAEVFRSETALQQALKSGHASP